MLRGFIVANENEEFLAEYNFRRGAIMRAWTIFPHLAYIFPSPKEAKDICDKLESQYNLYVLGIEETKTQFMVFTLEENDPIPSWLAQ